MPTISITPNGVQFPIPDCDAEVFYDPKTRTLLIEGLTDEDRITTRSDSRDGSQAVLIRIA
ncbi:hypothetical protein SEA_NICHOLAS_75 [Mycobacterium phage Nicholas]|uniref:Uncharacterized protein n=1 Tax=Mycobacterium phage Lumos TaxID=1701852 RepID=A0A0K2CMJ5_9CAUD|nr:hypothetical protein AVU96_gp104 [Mycobacterium phage Snenia]YP_010012535.1 hypothetical protein J4T93_gp101 [Mycobacterium phage Lumos]ASM62812.1 hypothetical protein SEA_CLAUTASTROPHE_75 [Mycobacterium phage Clautastrophe]ASR87003.1 hypothetical protein SEA_KINGSOLOMON_75 [Mycobacterium phage Kingsolomon]ASR87346.1 hypothetical protein SEA_NICHOLAS_75 [Mycobacterium phage Nicholas]AYB70429.1 hypothetical protein SEA_SAMTY_76 [Mycobacterium phage Samty]QDF16660.1 hypothetical protein PBI_